MIVRYSQIFKSVFYLIFGIIGISESYAKTNNDSLKKSNSCKELAIKSAQMANESFEFAQNCYFHSKNSNISQNIDSAIYFIQQSISLLDSTLLLANDSNIIGIKLAKNARNFSIDAYRCFKSINSESTVNNKVLLKKAMYFSENATIDSYHSSLYLIDQLKKETGNKKNSDVKNISPSEKVITKLDIDQSLFTILKEDLIEKKEANTKEIVKLTEELFNITDSNKQLKLKSRLKELETQKTTLEQKQNDAQQKLTTINLLIEEREKMPNANKPKIDTTYIKNKNFVTDEWGQQIKANSEMPDFLIYQIQLGVFKSNVLAETFRGLTPIYTTISDKGISYSIGVFEKLSDAQEAKNNIKSMGLTDAFIVAYYKKKKISLAEASKLEKK
ncbi:MAG: hypothetical protein JNM51_13525 [Bacteroidia bacterium]|nr:hypothetical protein [Bacteroidia bacterium]